MTALLALVLTGALAWLATKIIHFVVNDARLKKCMPPSPPGYPLVGNLFVPKLQWVLFTKWRDELGSIISLHIFGQRIVILNDFETAASLLDRRSPIYSDRPKLIMAGSVITGGMSLPFVEHGDRMRRMRRACHEGFSDQACIAYHELLEERAIKLVSRLLDYPDRHDKQFRWYAASMVLGSVYGWSADDASSDSVTERINALSKEAAEAIIPGKYLVEFFPWMLHLPSWLAKWKRDGQAVFDNATSMFEGFIDGVETKMQDGHMPRCFAATLIEEHKHANLDAHETAWLAGTMFAGGSDTTAATLAWFVFAMILHPDVQKRAQTHIDEIVGRHRLPTLDDRERLPYIDALVKELLRWRPAVPLSIPRRNTRDDWYKGHFIPQGSLIICNVWAANRDPKHFPDYDAFRPERYIDSNGQLSDNIPDTHRLGHLSFGSGRRQCPGKELAGRALFTAVANMLWAFDIEPAHDLHGNPLIPSRTACIDEGAVVRPPEFVCRFLPRCSDVEMHILRAVENPATV